MFVSFFLLKKKIVGYNLDIKENITVYRRVEFIPKIYGSNFLFGENQVFFGVELYEQSFRGFLL